MSDPLYDDPALAVFYDHDNTFDSADYRSAAEFVRSGTRLLDIGCGTGRFAVARATEVDHVTGADPSGAMLNIGRTRPGGDRVTWVQSDAQSLDLVASFDRITMLGHAFQTLLTPHDRETALKTMAAHLTPDGQLLLDSRNPLARAWEGWTEEATRETIRVSPHGDVTRWNTATQDAATGIVTYTTHYKIAATGMVHSARSRIAFPAQAELAAMLPQVGLRPLAWAGDWECRAFDDSAPEIVLRAGPA
jgi:ubiquinone/menaquinone biosynthesis C-methylase UbiE